MEFVALLGIDFFPASHTTYLNFNKYSSTKHISYHCYQNTYKQMLFSLLGPWALPGSLMQVSPLAFKFNPSNRCNQVSLELGLFFCLHMGCFPNSNTHYKKPFLIFYVFQSFPLNSSTCESQLRSM